MAEYEGVSRTFEVENVLTELLDLWDSGTITIYAEADLDEIKHVEEVITRATMALDGDLDVEVELDPAAESEQ